MALRKPQRAKIVVVPREQLWGGRRVILWAILHSAATTVGTCMASQVRVPASIVLLANAYGPWELVHAFFIVGVLIVAPIPWLYHHTPGWRIVAYAAIYALGLVIWKEIAVLAVFDMELRIPILYRPGMAIFFLFASNLLIGGFVLSCAAWLICRLVRGPIAQQDGTLCPNCAYSLVGCMDEICPECGREFTYQELGTTHEQMTEFMSKNQEHTEVPLG